MGNQPPPLRTGSHAGIPMSKGGMPPLSQPGSRGVRSNPIPAGRSMQPGGGAGIRGQALIPPQPMTRGTMMPPPSFARGTNTPLPGLSTTAPIQARGTPLPLRGTGSPMMFARGGTVPVNPNGPRGIRGGVVPQNRGGPPPQVVVQRERVSEQLVAINAESPLSQESETTLDVIKKP